MHRIGIIGLGVIYCQYIQALAVTQNLFRLVAVCDRDESVLSEGLRMACATLNRDDVQAYTDVSLFLDSSEIDVVVVATPPATHYSLALECIKAEKDILVEKPAMCSMEDFMEVGTLCSAHSRLLQTAFHAAYAADLLWFINNRQNVEYQYSLGQITEIICGFYDPYVDQGCLMFGRDVLGGSYLDSGVNELSVISRLTELNDLHVVEHNVSRLLDSGIVCQSQTVLKESYGNFVVRLQTDWTLGKNEKTTRLVYDMGNAILLNHTTQTVTLIEGDRKTVLYDNKGEPRLLTQYVNMLKDYAVYLDGHISNCAESLAIHRLLLFNFLDI